MRQKVCFCCLGLLIILAFGVLIFTKRSDFFMENKEPQIAEETNNDIDSDKIYKEEEEKENKKDYDGYDYSKPVPESEKAAESYFDDAVFIGDSRTEGFMLNAGLTNATFYSHKGITVKTVFTEPAIKMGNSKVSIMDALKKTKFSKVYIMLGINETGWVYSSMFIEKYGEIIDRIRQSNPDAVIYVQQILPVSRKVSKEHRYINNKRIREFNRLLQEMAEEKKVCFLNVAKAVENEKGVLPDDAAVDGIHLKKEYCQKWLEYLETHVVQ
ncbi:MAG: GDSL-type esterase/lipase family protein [Lachnospiraceae bacterium]